MKLFSILLLSLLLSCSKNDGPVKRSWGKMKGLDKIVGNMSDVSYSSGRSQDPRPNALGETVHMTDFEGAFVWADYAAPWCQPCVWQTPQVQDVERELGEEVVFLTIMTSKSNAYNDHATVETAKQWSSRFRLPPERTLAAQLWYKTIPEHRLYSPEGHTLFVHVGTLTAEQIKEVIAFYKEGYEQYAEDGILADWMYYR